MISIVKLIYFVGNNSKRNIRDNHRVEVIVHCCGEALIPAYFAYGVKAYAAGNATTLTVIDPSSSRLKS